MLKLSTKGRYGTRLMLELALRYSNGSFVLLKDIANCQGISERYLEQILPLLRTAGLITSRRGAKGGYALAKPPSEITLGAIVRAAEGIISLVDCVENPGLCPKANDCLSRDIWVEVSSNFTGHLDSVTLQDILKRKKREGR